MSEIIDSVDVVVTTRSVLRVETLNGVRYLWRDSSVLADDGPEEKARMTDYALAIKSRRPDGATIAMIGCGFCLLGRMHILAPQFTFTAYDTEVATKRFADECGCAFVPGDWHDTLAGTFDVIVYDIGDPVPYDLLAPHLNPGGIILPERSHA